MIYSSEFIDEETLLLKATIEVTEENEEEINELHKKFPKEISLPLLAKPGKDVIEFPISVSFKLPIIGRMTEEQFNALVKFLTLSDKVIVRESTVKKIEDSVVLLKNIYLPRIRILAALKKD